MRFKSHFASPLEAAIHQARQQENWSATLTVEPQISPEPAQADGSQDALGTDVLSVGVLPPRNDQGVEVRWAVVQERRDEAERDPEGGDASAAGWLDQAYRELVFADLDHNLARSITEKASQAWQALPQSQRASGRQSFRQTLAECVSSQIKFVPSVQCANASGPALVFVGPPGAGKTTTVMKVAIHDYLNLRIPVCIVSVDPHHVSCHEKARTLAALIGARFAAVDTLPEFGDALREFRGQGALLIDTPGYSSTESAGLRELAAWLSHAGDRQTHLVLPAWFTKRDLARLVRQHEDFAPDALLFTQLDETESYGAMISAALEVNKPLSFFASGQNIPDDIGPASQQALFAALFHGVRVESAWAA